jgi:hypothetical protein
MGAGTMPPDRILGFINDLRIMARCFQLGSLSRKRTDPNRDSFPPSRHHAGRDGAEFFSQPEVVRCLGVSLCSTHDRHNGSFRYGSESLANRSMRYSQSDRCDSQFRYSSDFHYKRHDLPLAKLAIDSLRTACREFAAQVGQPLRPLELLNQLPKESIWEDCADCDAASGMPINRPRTGSWVLAAGNSPPPAASPSRKRFAQTDLPIRPAKSAQRVLPNLPAETIQLDKTS